MENNLEYNSRFKSAEWATSPFLTSTYHHIIGLGGIGSHLAFQLARTGITYLYLYDFDKVEIQNVGGQLFATGQLETFKVDATREILNNFIFQNMYLRERYDKLSYLPSVSHSRRANEVYFICVDNMETRSNLARDFKNKCSTINFKGHYFESRLGPTGYELFYVNRNTIDFYLENCLFTDEEANGLTCSFQQTTHVASALASDIVSVYTNVVTNLSLNRKENMEDFEFVPTPFYIKSDNVLMTKTTANVDTWKK
jgi:hypothetical protein